MTQLPGPSPWGQVPQNASPRKRLPRLGLLHETFGVPFLIGFGVIVFLICAIVAGFLLSQALAFNAAGAESKTWPSAPGTILESDYSTRINKRGLLATIHIRYRFAVDGAEYTGTTLSFEKLNSLSESEAQTRLRPYPVGGECQVFYDPSNPQKNVLEKGVKSGNVGQMLAAFAFLIGGLVGLYDGVAGAINAHRNPPPSQPRQQTVSW